MAILKNKRKFSKEEKQEAWERYWADSSDVEAYNVLLEAYIPLVEIIASKFKSSLPPHLEIGDLLNDGFFGLVDAIEKYNPDRGWKFETYASSRVRGAISDRLRDYDWVSRYSRLRFKNMGATVEFLVQELGREPTDSEVAERLGWSMEEYFKVKAQFHNSYSANIDEYLADDSHEVFSLEELLTDYDSVNLGFDVEQEDLIVKLQQSLFSLPEHESIVLYLVIYEMYSIEKVALTLEIKEKEVTRLFNSAIKSLRSMFGVV